MDEQLKRRLVGAAIIVLLAVVAVPQFFEDKSREIADSAALPAPLEERNLVLPKDTAAPFDGTVESPNAGVQETPPPAAPKKRKFEVIPLEDPPPKPARVEAPAPDAPIETIPLADEGSFGVGPAEKPVPPAPALIGKTKPSASKSAPKGLVTEPPPRMTATPKPKAAAPSGAASKKTTSAPPKNAPAPASAKPAKATAPASRPAPVATTRKTEPSVKAKQTQSPAKKPSTSASAPKSATGTGASWTVQAGTFADESNAKALAEKLKKRNLPARIQASEGANGKVYRVTVGPNLDRGRAEKIQKDLSAQDDVKGVILQHR